MVLLVELLQATGLPCEFEHVVSKLLPVYITIVIGIDGLELALQFKTHCCEMTLALDRIRAVNVYIVNITCNLVRISN